MDVGQPNESTDLGEPGSLGGGEGTFGGIIWPTHLGAAVAHPGVGPRPANEPTGDPDYGRGQIEWMLESDGPYRGQIVGRASVRVPAGRYTHLVFTYGPADLPLLAGATQFEHPLVYERAGVMDVYPIQNQDTLPR